jgi:hypothetical protein
VRRSHARLLETSHLVDEHGLVGCPGEGRDVDATRCLHCRELLVAVRASDGHLVEIRCNVPVRPVRSPWDLLAPR